MGWATTRSAPMSRSRTAASPRSADLKGAARETVDAGGLTLMPGIIDMHTHYDAQVTWDPTLSPSPSLGVTTAVMGNCGFGIVPAPPPLRDLIMRNLAVVEGMDLDALRAGIDWQFQSFAEYMAMLRRPRPLHEPRACWSGIRRCAPR